MLAEDKMLSYICLLAIITHEVMGGAQRMKKNAHFLRALHQGDKRVRQALLKGASRDEINCLCEICLNVLKGKVKLSSKQKAELSTYKNSLRKLASKSTAGPKKRSLLQRGGLIGALLGPLIRTVIGPIAKGLLQ